RAGDMPRDHGDRRCRLLDLGIVTKPVQAGELGTWTQLQYSLKHGLGADRVALGPSELQTARPVAQRRVPAPPGSADALVVVKDQPIEQAVAAIVGQQGP